jgi:hypothetical protein
MKAVIYPFFSNHHGFYVQKHKPSQVFDKITKKELIGLADMRHPVLNENEYYETLSTDINGRKRNEFELLGSTFLIVVTN